MRKLTLGFLLLAALPGTVLAGAQITIVNGDAAGVGLNDPTPATPVGGNTGTTLGQQRLIALQYVASLWGAILDSPIEIRVQAHFSSLLCNTTNATLAQTGPTQALSDFAPDAGFPGPEFSGNWYPSALANRRTGHDLTPGNPNTNADDMRTTINSMAGQTGCFFDFYLGLDNQHGDKVDLVTTMLHEFAHGFGFLTFVTTSSGAEFQGQPDIYERYILDNTSGKRWTDMTDAERMASATNTGKLSWAGGAVTATAPAILHGVPTLQVTAPASVSGNYAVGLATFGPPVTEAGLSGPLVAAEDASDVAGPATTDACSALTNASAVAGKFVLVDRGTCTFVIKTNNVQAAGGIGIVVADNVDGSPPPGMGGTDPNIHIPAVRITKADGATLRAALGSGVSVKLYLDGTRLAGVDSTGHVLLYAPNPLEGGSSISHWDTSVVPDLLLEPNIGSDLSHGVDLTIDQLRDIGWYPDLVARDALTPVHRTHVPHAQPPRP